jgi:hypothetical protein
MSPAMRRPLLQGFVSQGLTGLAGPERNICCPGGGERLIERGEGHVFPRRERQIGRIIDAEPVCACRAKKPFVLFLLIELYRKPPENSKHAIALGRAEPAAPLVDGHRYRIVYSI